MESKKQPPSNKNKRELEQLPPATRASAGAAGFSSNGEDIPRKRYKADCAKKYCKSSEMDENRNPEAIYSSSSVSSTSSQSSCSSSASTCFSGCSLQSDSSHAMLCTAVPAAELQIIEEMVDESTTHFEVNVNAPPPPPPPQHNVTTFDRAVASVAIATAVPIGGPMATDSFGRDGMVPAAVVVAPRQNDIVIFNDIAMPAVNLQAYEAAAVAAGGRAIVNTSLIKLAAANNRGGRSPLATVVSNNKNAAPAASVEAHKRNSSMTACNDESFFVFNSRQPQYFGKDNFSRLSDEMVLYVFKWLPKKTLLRCSLVNRRFRNLAEDESLWGRLDLSGKTLRPAVLGHILPRGVVVCRMAQTNIVHPVWNEWELPADFSIKLLYLDLSMADVPKQTLAALLSRCRRLKKLSLEHVPLDRAVCLEIAANRQLEVLNLAMCDGIDVRSIRRMMNELKHLQSLNISWTSLSADGVQAFVDAAPVGLLRLNMAGCRKMMTDSHLMTLVHRCPGLVELDISDCTSLGGDTIDIICQCKQLEYLSLSRCYNITYTSYFSINKLPALAYFDIFGVLTEACLGMLQNSYPSVGINKFIHSAVARPTVGHRRTSIWGLRTRD